MKRSVVSSSGKNGILSRIQRLNQKSDISQCCGWNRWWELWVKIDSTIFIWKKICCLCIAFVFCYWTLPYVHPTLQAHKIYRIFGKMAQSRGFGIFWLIFFQKLLYQNCRKPRDIKGTRLRWEWLVNSENNFFSTNRHFFLPGNMLCRLSGELKVDDIGILERL